MQVFSHRIQNWYWTAWLPLFGCTRIWHWNLSPIPTRHSLHLCPLATNSEPHPSVLWGIRPVGKKKLRPFNSVFCTSKQISSLMVSMIPKVNFMAIQTTDFNCVPFQYQGWFGILSNSIPSLPISTSKQSLSDVLKLSFFMTTLSMLSL